MFNKLVKSIKKDEKKTEVQTLEDYKKEVLEHANEVIKYFVTHPMKKGMMTDSLQTVINHVNNLDLQISTDLLFNVKRDVSSQLPEINK